MMENLAGAPFSRIRVGIGRPPAGIETADYVLRPFEANEAAELDEIVNKAADAALALLRDGAEAAMREFNRPS